MEKLLGVRLIEQILAHNLTDFDIYFTENDALYVAAGTYIAGYKQVTPTSTVIPYPIYQIWQQNEALQIRFPNPNNLTTTVNFDRHRYGCHEFSEIANYLNNIIPFNKKDDLSFRDRTAIRAFSFVEPEYGAIGFEPTQPLEIKAKNAILDYTQKTTEGGRGMYEHHPLIRASEGFERRWHSRSFEFGFNLFGT